MPRRRLISMALLLLVVLAASLLGAYAMWRRGATREAAEVFDFLKAMPRAEQMVIRGTLCDDVPSLFVLTDAADIDRVATIYGAARPTVDYGTSWALHRGAALGTNIAGTIEIEAAGERLAVRYVSPYLLIAGDTTAVRLDGFDIHTVHEALLSSADAGE